MDAELDIQPIISNKAMSVHMGMRIDLFEFSTTHANCIINDTCTWRCTFFSKGLVMNMYESGYFILFSRTMNEADVCAEMKRLFGKEPRSIFMRNMVVKFYYPTKIDLEGLYDKLNGNTLDDLFNFHNGLIDNANKPNVIMNKQLFSAMRVRPFPETKIALSIFASGAIGVAGVKTNEDLDRSHKYIATVLHPLIQEIEHEHSQKKINM